VTRREIFEKIKKHLLSQGKQSMKEELVGNGCAYRGEDGLKCAIGCLIPDELYSLEIERDIVDLRSHYKFFWIPFIKHLGIEDSDETIHFLSDLQRIHDHEKVEDWESSFDELEKEYFPLDKTGSDV